MKPLSALGLALALCLAAPSTAAQPAPEAEARAYFEQGVSLADAARWAEALAAFQHSLRVVPRSSTRLNIARALLRLGRLRAAVEAFDGYLLGADPGAEAARIAEATQLREEARAALAVLVLTGVPDAAEVLADGELRLGTGPTRVLPLDPGSHHIEVRDTNQRTARFDVVLTRSSRETRAVSLSRDGAAAEPAPTPTPTPPFVAPSAPAPASRSVLQSPWFWVATVAVVGGVVTALALTLDTTAAPYGGSTGRVLTVP